MKGYHDDAESSWLIAITNHFVSLITQRFCWVALCPRGGRGIIRVMA